MISRDLLGLHSSTDESSSYGDITDTPHEHVAEDSSGASTATSFLEQRSSTGGDGGVFHPSEGLSSGSANTAVEDENVAALRGEELDASASTPAPNPWETVMVMAHREGYEPVAAKVRDLYVRGDVVLEPDANNMLSLANADLSYILDGSAALMDKLEVAWTVELLKSEDTHSVPEGAYATLDNTITPHGAVAKVVAGPANVRVGITATVTKRVTMASEGDDSKVEQVGYFAATATIKYVRRELRTLREADREKYFQTLQDMISIDQEQGESAYGEDFLSLGSFTALHTTDKYQYHNNLFFSTSHAAMQLKFDRSLLAVAGGGLVCGRVLEVGVVVLRQVRPAPSETSHTGR